MNCLKIGPYIVIYPFDWFNGQKWAELVTEILYVMVLLYIGYIVGIRTHYYLVSGRTSIVLPIVIAFIVIACYLILNISAPNDPGPVYSWLNEFQWDEIICHRPNYAISAFLCLVTLASVWMSLSVPGTYAFIPIGIVMFTILPIANVLSVPFD